MSLNFFFLIVGFPPSVQDFLLINVPLNAWVSGHLDLKFSNLSLFANFYRISCKKVQIAEF